MGAGETTLAGPAAKTGPWGNPQASAAQSQASAGFGETVGPGSAFFGLERHWLAARQSGNPALPLCRCACAPCASRRETHPTTPRRMAFGRMAEGRGGTHEILVVQLTPHNLSGGPWRSRAKHRWVIERDYEELKQELGLGHFEGRSWRGFHHHATLCIAEYGSLMEELNRFSPSTRVSQCRTISPGAPSVDFRPRGSPRPPRTA